jgi:predicted acyltransferase
VSVDALRGFDMIWILGADAAVRALGRVTKVEPFTTLATQFEHKAWAGFAFYDLIFPLFVFIVGVSTVFSLGKLVEQEGRAAAVRRVLARGALLYVLGVIHSGGLTNAWPNIRLLGVLQRIALAYTAAGLLYCFVKPRALAALTVALLVGYWALLTFVPIRDFQLHPSAFVTRFGTDQPTPEVIRQAFDATTTKVTGGYEPGLNLTNHLDFAYLGGRKYDTYYDPEGLLSTLPAVATCLLGVFAGLLLRRSDLSPAQKFVRLAIAGVATLALGSLWGLQFPVVKKLWTSSFVLVAGGWSMLLLAAFYYVVDIRGWKRWCTAFVWVGMNPITLYLAAGLVSFRNIGQRFVGGDVKLFFESSVGTGAGDLIGALAAVALVLWLARFLIAARFFCGSDSTMTRAASRASMPPRFAACSPSSRPRRHVVGSSFSPPEFLLSLMHIKSFFFLTALLPLAVSAAERARTTVSIEGEKFLLNGTPTYAGRTWDGVSIEGRLMNSRMVQGTFDDLNPETRSRWTFPDGKPWDPDRNTREFIAAMPEWRRHGLLAFTLNLQGGSPEGYSRNQPWINNAFEADGTLRVDYKARLARILDRANELGMVVILGIFYFGQDERLKDEAAVVRAVDQTIDWLFTRGDRHVLIEINN